MVAGQQRTQQWNKWLLASNEDNHGGGWSLAISGYSNGISCLWPAVETSMVVGGYWPTIETAMVVGSCWPEMETTMVLGSSRATMDTAMELHGCLPSMWTTMVMHGCSSAVDRGMAILVVGQQWCQPWW